MKRRLALAGLPALFVLHNDFWLWDNPRIVLGLPIGMLYHVTFCVAATLVMQMLITHAWPEHLEIEREPGAGGEPG